MTTGTKGLMLWCQNITKNYGVDVEIKNMTSSWKNGLAFCAILHHYRPDLIDFSKLSKENVGENNALAFRIAEDELGIPALLDVEDMVNMRSPDHLSILTYVSQYYNYFKDKVPGDIVTHRIPSKKRPHTENIDVVPAKLGTPPGKLTVQNTSETSRQDSLNACFNCGKTVFLMERLTAEGNLYHRVCFKCVTCGVQLKTSTYEFHRSERRLYCEKHSKDRGKTRSEPDGKENKPEKERSEIHEELVVKDENISNLQQNAVKGIRSLSSPTDILWEKTHVIKSKQEDHQSQAKSKDASKFFLASVLKRKSQSTSSDDRDFANPAYQQHLDLSNYMHQLQTNSNNIPNERVVMGSVSTAVPDKEKASSLSELRIHAPSVNKFSGKIEEDSKKSSVFSKGLKKKKLVLKVKKKKNKADKEKESEDEKEKDGKRELGDDIKKYENVDILVLKKEDSNNHRANMDELPTVFDEHTSLPEAHDEPANLPAVFGEHTSLPEAHDEPANFPTVFDEHASLPEAHDEPENVKSEENTTVQEELQNNLRNENAPEANKNSLLLSARNNLRASGRTRFNDGTVNIAGAEYLDIKANLRKVKSSENISGEMDVKKIREDLVVNTLLDTRLKLHKTGFAENESFTSIDGGEVCQNEKQSQIILQQKTPLNSCSSIESLRDCQQINDTPIVEKDIIKPDSEISDSDYKKANVETFDDSSQNPFISPEDSPELSLIVATNVDSINPSEHSPSPNPFEDTSCTPKVDCTNPFEDSPDEECIPDHKSSNANPFLSSMEDLNSESDLAEEFDSSNPFAEDVEFERKSTLERKKQPQLNKNTIERMSLRQRQELERIGIDESNPFVVDVLEDLSDDEKSHEMLSKKSSIRVPQIESRLPMAGNKKLVLRTRNQNKPPNRPISAPVTTGVVAGATVKKKRAAPKPPVVSNAISSPISNLGTVKKRQAPERPTVLQSAENTDKFIALTNEMNTIDSQISQNNEMLVEKALEQTFSDKRTNRKISDSHAKEITKSGSENHDNAGENYTDTVLKVQEDCHTDNIIVTAQEDSTITQDDVVSPLVASTSALTKPLQEIRINEKRKAPLRPSQPYVVDEEVILKGVALRDKQPNRAEMEAEMQYLEIRQRELEIEGVVMEKKLRECSGDEPEEAYLLTWFELVNQKNLLLRRENELIYLCQEQDFLRNQRRAEFELRQLLNKPESEKTIEDQMREDELLANILQLVTKRSNIVDRMDEDRMREYEEDQEISNMMETQGLTSPKKTQPMENKGLSSPKKTQPISKKVKASKDRKKKEEKKGKNKNKATNTKKSLL